MKPLSNNKYIHVFMNSPKIKYFLSVNDPKIIIKYFYTFMIFFYLQGINKIKEKYF